MQGDASARILRNRINSSATLSVLCGKVKQQARSCDHMHMRTADYVHMLAWGRHELSRSSSKLFGNIIHLRMDLAICNFHWRF